MLHLFDGAAWVDIGPSSPGSPGGGTSVGTSPPQNPAVGTTWWNGAIFQVWDGTAWRLAGGAIVSTTAPGSPVAGETWWNGTMFQVWDGTMWQLVGPPSTQTSTVPQFAITNTGPKAISTTAWTIVPFSDTPQTDLQNGWDAAGHRYIPKVAGSYIFLIRGYPDGIALVKNDPGTFTGLLSSDIVVGIATQTPPDGWLASTGLAQMNGTTDFVRFWARAASGSFPATGANACFTASML